MDETIKIILSELNQTQKEKKKQSNKYTVCIHLHGGVNC